MIRFLIPAMLWTILTILLSVASPQSMSGVNPSLPNFDKIVHFTLYVFNVYFWTVGLKKQTSSKQVRENAFYYALIGAFFLGLTLELIQHFFIKNRYFEVQDLIANSFGCIFGLVLFKMIYKTSYIK